MYTDLTSLQKGIRKSIVDYIIRARNIASSLKTLGEGYYGKFITSYGPETSITIFTWM